MNNNQDFENILKNCGKGIDREAIKKAKQTGDASALIKNLSNDDKQKLNNILNDKQKLSEVLKNPGAQALLRLFSGGKNG